MKKNHKTQLQSQLRRTKSDLIQTKIELAREYIALAEMESEAAHLDSALEVLSSMNATFSMENAVADYVEVQSQVAEGLLRLGREHKNRLTLEKAKHAYRSAITLASILGDDNLREDLRQKYRLTLSLLGDKPESPSLFKVA